MSNIERAKKLFAKNKEAQEVHCTSDGYLFFDKKKAEGHAGTLSNRELETISREQAESHKEEPVKGENSSETGQTAANKTFEQMLLERTVAELKKLATEYQLSITGRENKGQLVKLIAEHAQKQKTKPETAEPTKPELTELEIAQRTAEAQGKISEEDKAALATGQ